MSISKYLAIFGRSFLIQKQQMANSFFKFKQFTVWHDKCAMKVGTDGVLLGAWAAVDHAQHILDVGAGTGLVSLMLAQRSKALITGIEVDELAALQAVENVEKSPWAHRITIAHADFNRFETTTRYDVIVSNPPYFVDSLKCPESTREKARHNSTLTFHDLLCGVSQLLTPEGTFTVIIPTDSSDAVKQIAAQYQLTPCSELSVITTPGASPKRTLIAFRFGAQTCTTDTLLVELSRHVYSPQYIELTRAFYLKM